VTARVDSPAPGVLRRVVWLLLALQTAFTAVIPMALRGTVPLHFGPGAPVQLLLAVAALSGLCLLAAVLFHPHRQHLAMAFVLLPFAGWAGLSVFVN